MAPVPDISVVVATYNRAEVLRRTLEHLADQTLAPHRYEVIVVDDGSPDHTAEVVDRAVHSVPFGLTYLHHANRGPGFTQNRGIRRAAAPIVLLIADDIFLSRGALEAHLEAHARWPAVEVAILGSALKSPELIHSAFQRKWDPFMLDRLEQGQEMPCMKFWACNISFKRRFMMEHGMFRDEIGPGGPAAHEDVELGYRLAERGLRIFHEKGALGYHHHVESLETAMARSYSRGLNWDEFYRRLPYPELDVRYRVYSLGTLIRWRRELHGSRRKYLDERDRCLTKLALASLLRAVLFNGPTIRAFWMPMIRLAERSRLVEAILQPWFYRGVVVYQFRKGYRDARRKPSGPADSGTTGKNTSRTH